MTKKSALRLIKEDMKTQEEINNAFSIAVARLGDAKYRLDKHTRDITKEMAHYTQLINELHEQAAKLNPPKPTPVVEAVPIESLVEQAS